jgi:hypothetical protein
MLAETGFAQLAAHSVQRLLVQQPIRGEELNPVFAQQCVCRSKQSCCTLEGAARRGRGAESDQACRDPLGVLAACLHGDDRLGIGVIG